MTTDDSPARGFSLKRWSQRKLEAARAAPTPAADAPTPPSAPAPAEAVDLAATAPTVSPGADVTRVEDVTRVADVPSLPPIESLTSDSDFGGFLDPNVDPAVRLQALKKLFRDPRFNVMDGLDVYIDDYSIADPIAPELVRQLAHARYIFDPPRTRVNDAGIVEDVPADEAPSEASSAAGAAPPALPDSQAASSSPTVSSATPNAAADSRAAVAPRREGSEPAGR